MTHRSHTLLALLFYILTPYKAKSFVKLATHTLLYNLNLTCLKRKQKIINLYIIHKENPKWYIYIYIQVYLTVTIKLKGNVYASNDSFHSVVTLLIALIVCQPVLPCTAAGHLP